MATITKTVEGYTAPGRIEVQWEAFGDADSGAPMRLYNVQSLQVDVRGTAGGAACTIEGSMDGTNYSVLHDADGSDLTFAAGTIPRTENVRECTVPYIRPRTSGGSGTALTVRFVAQQNMR